MSVVPLPPLAPSVIAAAVDAALAEDLGPDMEVEADLTGTWVLGADADQPVKARILSRQQGIVAGLDLAAHTFHRLDPAAEIRCVVAEGDRVETGQVLLEILGRARPLVVGERTALNFLQHLGGVATLTRAYVDAISDTGARITDTRKTTPGLRRLERHAVRCGGGVNHRFNLADAVLIKENHVHVRGGVVEAVQRARAGALTAGRREVRIMCEAENLAQVRHLVAARATWPDRILLDNMPAEMLTEAVTMVRQAAGRQIELEATGGIDLGTCRAVARTGVDLLSVGALTHSAPAMDLSMLVEGA